MYLDKGCRSTKACSMWASGEVASLLALERIEPAGFGVLAQGVYGRTLTGSYT